MPRIKVQRRNLIASRTDAEVIVGRLSQLQTRLNGQKCKMDAELQTVRARYEADISVADRQIEELTLELEAWASENRHEFGADRKSIVFVHGTIGFRTGTPKVKKGRKFPNLEAVADAMKQFPWARKYIKQSAPSVNKEALIADRDRVTADQLNQVGLAIVQDETFFVDPKVETLEQGVTAA